MKCIKAQKLILLQDSGELSPARRRKLASHLQACEQCRRFARDLGRLTDLVQTNLVTPEPPPLPAPGETATVPVWWTPLRLASVAASLLLISALAIGYGLLRRPAPLPVPADTVAAGIEQLSVELEQLARDIANDAVLDPYNAMTIDEITEQLITVEDT